LTEENDIFRARLVTSDSIEIYWPNFLDAAIIMFFE